MDKKKKRTGAGGRKKRISLTLDYDTVVFFRDLGLGSVSNGVRIAAVILIKQGVHLT